MEQHLYYWQDEKERWMHSRICWCLVKQEPRYVQDDIRHYIGDKGSDRRYKWFDKDLPSFEPEPKSFTVKATVILEVKVDYTVRAKNSEEAIKVAKELAKSRVIVDRDKETIRGFDFIQVTQVV